jgi:circadian clock protein KaiB
MMRTKNLERQVEFDLTLYVSGASPNSLKAINNIQCIVEEKLKGRYSLNIVDIYQDKSAAASEQIVALPMLVKKSPLPEKRLIGDMSDTHKVLRGLGIE